MTNPLTQTIRKQKVNGVILIDKPQGMTSQQAVSKVKWLFKSPEHDSKKAGHTGTLDPMATGLLPICLGEATKFSHYQLDADKSYQAVLRLGEQTDTGDAEGRVIATTGVTSFDIEKLKVVTEQFSGNILQTPPMYSALKKNGKKLYEYARAGIEVERESRPITIRHLLIEQIDDVHLKLVVTCSKGTYIRTLGEEIAKALGTLGHLTVLKRTGVGGFNISDAISLEDLTYLTYSERFNRLLNVAACLGDMPILKLDNKQCERLRLGQRLNVFDQMQSQLNQSFFSDSEQSTDVQLHDDYGQFVGLGVVSKDGRLQPKKMIVL